MDDPRYQRWERFGSAVGCKHRIQNRANTECAVCGARRDGLRKHWHYMTAEWQDYFDNGGERPGEPGP